MKEKYKYFLIVIAMVVLDQGTKELAVSYLSDGAINIFGDVFKLTLVYNPGIAFGVRLGGQFVLSGISLIASIAIGIYIYKIEATKKLELWSFTFILGGALGNFIDRALYGKVVDFLDCDFPDINIPQFQVLGTNFSGYQLFRWPVFNIADSFVSIGMILLLILYFFSSKDKQSKR